MHQLRRDGSIFDCYLDENNNMCTGKQIFANCTKVLNRLSLISDYNPLTLPTLPELNQDQVQFLKDKMARNKAISYDGITHQFIRECNWKILKNVWN